MTVISTKVAGDRIGSAEMNALLNKVQNGTDYDVNIGRIIMPSGFTSTRIQNAISSLSGSKGMVICQAATFTVGTTVTLSSYVTLSLNDGTKFLATAGLAAQANYMVVQFPINTKYATLRGGVIDGAGLSVMGVHFRIFGSEMVSHSRAEYVTVLNCGRDGAFIIGGRNNVLSGCIAENTQQIFGGTIAGFFITGLYTERIVLSNCISRLGTSAVRGFIFEDQCRDIELIGCIADRNNQNQFSVEGGAGSPIENISFSGCRATSGTTSDTSGFRVNWGRSISFSNCLSEKNAAGGFVITNATNVSVVGCTALNNGRVAASGYRDGIDLDAATDCIVIGCTSIDRQSTRTQVLGLRELGTSDRNIVIGNNFRRNANTPINYFIVGASTQVFGNIED